jgi:hypothetical protein
MVTLKLQRHDDLLGIIISHADKVFDKTEDDLDVIKEHMRTIDERSQSQYDLIKSIQDQPSLEIAHHGLDIVSNEEEIASL